MIVIENPVKLIKNMEYNYKFCILAAGKGSRNKSIDGLHKALMPLENKPVVSHILDLIPIDVEIVMPVGYKADQIKDYLKNIHPERKITFVDVENYDKPGSGPGTSLLACAPYLQCPFIFTPVDTLTEENYNYAEVKNNWVGWSYSDESAQRRDYCLVDGETYLNKFYWGYGDKLFVGIAGIFDYNTFWKDLAGDKTLLKNEVQVFNGFTNLTEIELKYFTWYDTGDIDSYTRTKRKFHHDIVAPKIDEALFIDNNKVIKYFYDINKVEQRINRIKFLNETCPPSISRIDENMYSYNLIPGNTLSKINDETILKQLIPYWYEKLGSKRFEKNTAFINNCKTIYHDKTFNRCKYFLNTEIDNIQYINGIKVEKINDLLSKVNWNEIYDYAIPSNFHGDLQPENIIYGDKFTLIDWRESFGDNLEIGDFYYDLGKLYHALLVNGTDVNNKLYRIETKGNHVNIFNHSRSNLLFLLSELEKFCKNNIYSWENVKLLGALQYLGISSLYNDFHNGDYGKFLFLYGKYLLTKLINSK
jgi:hypothetical protein